MWQKIKGSVKSWTIWVNGIASAVVAGLPMLQENFPQLQPYIPANFYKYAMLVIIAINIVLRFKTNKPLEQK
jgi:hypothetical protein